MRISGVTYVPRKSHKVRNAFLISTLVIFLVVAAVALISVYTGWSLIHPKKIIAPSFTSNIVPEFKDAAFNDIKNELKLKGWYFEKKGSDRAVILAHGYGKNRMQFGDKTIDLIKSLQKGGYSVLTFDFRNSGTSEGKMVTLGIREKNDLLGAVRYANQQGCGHVVLMGFSTGASYSILAAAQKNVETKSIDAIIADSPFPYLREYLEAAIPARSGLPSFPFNMTTIFALKVISGIDPAKASPESVLNRIVPRPVLFISSKGDTSVYDNGSRELYKTYSAITGSRSFFWEAKGMGSISNSKQFPVEYADRVMAFLDEVYNKAAGE